MNTETLGLANKITSEINAAKSKLEAVKKAEGERCIVLYHSGEQTTFLIEDDDKTLLTQIKNLIELHYSQKLAKFQKQFDEL